MKVIDCFTFFNEIDLLEFRLRLLDKYVDHFVIVESNLTHSGNEKPYNFQQHQQRFAPWMNKIIYIPLQQAKGGLDFSKEETSYNPTSAAWSLENEHRNALSQAGKIAADNDLVLVSDLDEIPNPALLKKLDLADGPVALSTLFHYYFFNCVNIGRDRWWNATIVCTGKQFKQTTPQQLRDNRNVYKSIPKAGWHFSYLGGVEKIKQKIKSFAHTEFNKEKFLDDAHILKAINEGKDIFERSDIMYKFVPLYHYPMFLQKAMLHYPAFINAGVKNENIFTRLFYRIKNLFA